MNSSGPIYNNTVNRSCDIWYWHFAKDAEQTAYLIVPGIFLSLGLLVRCVCLLAFYRQSKKEGAYLYQVFIVILETLKVFADAGYYAVMIFCFGYDKVYKTMASLNYALFWYGAHLAVALPSTFLSACLLLACFMAADRYRALRHPFEYAQHTAQDHKRKFIRAFVFSVCLAVGINFYDFFRYKHPSLSFEGFPHLETAGYLIEENTTFTHSLFGYFLVCLRNIVQSISLVVMIVLNVLVVRLVWTQSHKSKVLRGESMEEKRKRKVLKSDIVLSIITTLECLFITISNVVILSYILAEYFWPSFELCESGLWTPVVDIIGPVVNESQLYFVILLSRRFRKIIFENIPIFQKLKC